MKRGLLISYNNRYELSLYGDRDSIYATTNKKRGRKLLKENCDKLFGTRKDDYVHYMPIFIVSDENNVVIVKNIHEDFFKDYTSLRCNHNEFKILRDYLDRAGWGWFENWGKPKKSVYDYNPDDLALISVKWECDKTIIPYFEDEIDYLDWDKDVKEILREIKLNELGI